jgi:hypothetical protein
MNDDSRNLAAFDSIGIIRWCNEWNQRSERSSMSQRHDYHKKRKYRSNTTLCSHKLLYKLNRNQENALDIIYLDFFHDSNK